MWAAQKILKDFSEEALVKAIHSKEFKGIFSLNHPKCIGVITKYEIQLDEQKNKPKQDIEVNKKPKVRTKSYGGNNILNKLRNIENGEKEDI